mmetsp:Transcript_17246/g.40101  ORF Transcript_17246/g.40101 Transcript_17246/m.40101 type:complete len:1016 (+) Transcript_17246:68-3115(+)
MLPVPMQYGTGSVQDVGGGRHGGTTPSQMSPTERGIVNPEREVESERMWWAEASERQVHELESTFQAEFTRACQALRAELGSSKDKLEMKVEDDRLAAQDRMNELRRMIESQGALVADIARKVEDERLAAQESMRELRWMIDNQAALVADVSRKADMTQLHRDAMPAVMPTDLRNELDALLLAQRRADQESAASFTGVKARVDAIQADVAHLRGETVPLLRSEIDAVQAEKLRTDEETSSSLEAVKKRVESVLADMANLRGDTVPRLRSELDDMVVARLQKDQAAAASMDAVSARVDAMQACLADVRRERVETTVPQSPLQADSAHLHANIVPLLRSELDAMQAASLRADKEISSSLDALKTRVDGIQEASMALDAIRTRMDAVQADVARLRGDTIPSLRSEFRSEFDTKQVTRLRTDQETISSLDALRMRVDSLQEAAVSSDSMKPSIEAVQADMAQLRGDTIPLLRRELDAMQATYLRADQASKALLDGLHTRVDSLQDAAASVDTMKTRVDAVQADMVNLRGDTVPLLRSELDAMQSAKLRSDQDTTSLLDGLKIRVDSLEVTTASLDAVKARMDSFQASLADVCRQSVGSDTARPSEQANMAHLHGEIVPLVRSELDAMQAAKLRTDQEITSALDALKRRVDSIQEAATVFDAVKGRVDAVQADVANLRGETVPLLRSELDAMQATKLRADQATSASMAALKAQLVESIQETSTSLDSMKARMDSFQASLTDFCNVCIGTEEVQQMEQARLGSQEVQPMRPVVAPPSDGAVMAAPPPSLLSPDLKSSIEGLVQRVNHTLTRQRDSAPSPSTSGGPPLQLAPPAVAAVSSAAALQTPTRYLHALQEVKELRERNLSLRERNAELVEELLTHDASSMPSMELEPSYSSSTPKGPSLNITTSLGGGNLPSSRLTNIPPAAHIPGNGMFADRASAAMRLSNTSTPGGGRSPTLGRSIHAPGGCPSTTPQLHPGMSGCASAKPQGAHPVRQASTARGSSPTNRLSSRVGAPPPFQR